MKTWLRYLTAALATVALLATAALSAVPQTLQAAEAPAAPSRTITVVGHGSVDARPDTARVTFGVTRLAPAAADAYAHMAQAMADLVAALKQAGVAEADMQTASLALNAEYTYDKDGQQHLNGYRASNNLTVTRHNLDGLGVLIDTAVAAGANSVSGVEFAIGNPDAYSATALDRATDDARAKANRVAARLGAVVTGATHITVQDESASPPPYYGAAGAAAPGARAELPVLAGTSRFQATVSVEFSLGDAPA